MNYITEFRKFIFGQYLNQGIRITAGAIVPAVVLYHFDLLNLGIAMPLGALMVSLTDNPGPIHHRRNGMLASNAINFFMAVIVGWTRYTPWLLSIEIALFSFFLSLAGIYGNRVNNIGLIALLTMVLSIDVHHLQSRIWTDALFMLAGGVWYMLLSLMLYSIRPYRLLQQALGESLISIASYLKAKARLYEIPTPYEEVYDELFSLQVTIQNEQEQLRELLYKTRRLTRDSTSRSRRFLMMFLDSIDLFEQVMTSQQDYDSLHRSFDTSGLLERFRKLILAEAHELEELGLAVQTGVVIKDDDTLELLSGETEERFAHYRSQELGPGSLEAMIGLRHVLNSIKDVADRIRKLKFYTSNRLEIKKDLRVSMDLEKFVSRERLDPELIWENLSFHSNAFRHALRVCIAILTGYLVAQFFPFGHSYWILLTIITILKPAYSSSKKRNTERLAGTLSGAGISFLCLYFIHNNEVLFAITIIAMVLGYSFLQLQYLVSVAGITVYVILSFHFLNPVDFRTLIVDRVIDTGIGSGIAFLAALFVFPKWEHEQLGEYVKALLEADLKYFHSVTRAFYAEAVSTQEYKIARKQTYVALANLSDAYQRSLSEPKHKLRNPAMVQQIVVACHMLTSHVASLSSYARTMAAHYRNEAFGQIVEAIETRMRMAIRMVEADEKSSEAKLEQPGSTQLKRLVNMLRDKRIVELEARNLDTQTQKELSGLKTISDQFEIIPTIVGDIIMILQKIRQG